MRTVVLGSSLFALILAWSLYDRSSGQQHEAKLMLGPMPIRHGGRAELERPHDGMLPRLHVIGGRVFNGAPITRIHELRAACRRCAQEVCTPSSCSLSEGAILDIYEFLDKVLKLRRPFTAVWDVRSVLWPGISTRLFQVIRAWVDANAPKWDTYLQGHAIIISNPIVRPVAKLIIKLFAPPQPIQIVANEAEALEFARTCCPVTRSYVKKSYADRDQRFGTFFRASGLQGSSRAADGSSGPVPAITILRRVLCIAVILLAVVLERRRARERVNDDGG